jgi:hypothetical protein
MEIDPATPSNQRAVIRCREVPIMITIKLPIEIQINKKQSFGRKNTDPMNQCFNNGFQYAVNIL